MPNLTGYSPEKLPSNGFLGTAAYINIHELLSSQSRSEMNIQGIGSSVNHIIRRPYPFTIGIVNSNGSTTTTLPTANADGSYTENTNYTLVHNAPAGTWLTIEIIPVLPII